MVKRDKNTSIPEDDVEPQILNENGKRPADSTKETTTKRLKTKSLYRQPTVKELNRLQETETLFNSNLFRLQVEEILQEVKPKEKSLKRFQQWFGEFKIHLESICEDDTEYDLTEETLFKKLKTKLPLSKEHKKTKCVFKFYKFKNVVVVGSYVLACAINSKLRVDIKITVPADTYTKNDSINYRYHKKRAAYLAYIASHLSKFELIEDIKYSWLNGCETKPVIDLKPSGKVGNDLSVRISLICEAEAYKLHRFGPNRNNLRETWLFSLENSENNNEVGPPTPYYNSSVLSDLTACENQEFLYETLSNCENLKQAVVLLKIWLRQRNLQVSGHIISLFVAYLVQMKRINNIMSSYQIVRNIWIAWKTSEWDTKGISLHKEDGTTPSIEEFHQHFPVVFLDRTGYYNICWQMCKGTYDALKRESSLAVEMLDNTKINSFIPLFMTQIQPIMQFDHILRFKNLPKLKESVINKASKQSRLNYGVDKLSFVTDSLYSLLAKGLGDRVELVLQMTEADFSWPVKRTPEKSNREGYKQKLSFGFIMNPENAFKIVEKGPPANLPESEEFRSFWGEKSELRRFQDGSITEACVWKADTQAERRTINKQIIDYLMELKYDIPQSELFHICDQLESLATSKRHLTPCEELSTDALRAFDDLRRDLRALTQLPLEISAVYGISPVFSYGAPSPPAPGAPLHNPWRRGGTCLIKDITGQDGTPRIPEYTPVCRAILEMSHSGKWPGDIEAFRCLKAAFHLQIAERLTKQYSLPTQAYAKHLDVLKNDLVFRLEIAHPKEITLLRREVLDGVVKHKESEDSVNLQVETVLLPRLRGALHGLHQKHPAYGPTTCLFKRWLSSHLLSPPHFPQTVAELLTATVFLVPPPLTAPTQPTIGLFRVLKLLAKTDWTTEMFVLDFNEDMKHEEITQLERQFNEREPKTARVHIVTAYDGDLPGVWGAGDPSPQVIARAQILAKNTLKYMHDGLLVDMKDNVLGAFVPSLAGYDVTIHLHPSLVPHYTERVDRKPEVRSILERPPADVVPVVEFHPVTKYLDELRSAYSDFALFFHDLYGGDVIAVLWKPNVTGHREFQLSDANALTPVKVKGETKYKVNIQALVEDFRILGAGLVKDIVVLT